MCEPLLPIEAIYYSLLTNPSSGTGLFSVLSPTMALNIRFPPALDSPQLPSRLDSTYLPSAVEFAERQMTNRRLTGAFVKCG